MNTDSLRADLTDLAEQVRPVDLHQRALAGSQRIVRRRFAVAAAVLLVMAGGAAVTVQPWRDLLVPAAPSPTNLPPPATPYSPPVSAERSITTGRLADARIDVPAFAGAPSCPSGETLFLGGSYLQPAAGDRDGGGRGTPTAAILITRTVEITLGGTAATVAALLCRDEQTTTVQVVAFRPTVENVYRPVATVLPAAAVVFGLTHDTADQVTVEVGDNYFGSPARTQVSQHQLRTFSWNGTGFAQSGGPTTFPVDPDRIALRLSTTDIAFRARTGRFWPGRVELKISNGGSAPAPQLALEWVLPGFVQPSGTAWTNCTLERVQQSGIPGSRVSCEIGALAAGEERTLPYEFVATEQREDGVTASVDVVQRPPYVPEALPLERPITTIPIVYRD